MGSCRQTQAEEHMNKYLFQAVTNVALVSGIVYLVMNDHFWFAFFLFLGIRVSDNENYQERKAD